MTATARNEGAPVASIADRVASKGAGRWWINTWYPGLTDRVPGIDSKTLTVARSLAKYAANKEDGHCWPSLAKLVKETRLSRSSVQRAITALELAGELYVDRGGPKGGSHYYLLDLDQPEREEAIADARRAAEDRRACLSRQKACVQKRERAAAVRGARSRRPAIAAGQLELSISEPGDEPASEDRLVTPPRWRNRHQRGGIRAGVTGGVPVTPPGVTGTPRSSKGSSHPPANGMVVDQEDDRERCAAALRALTGRSTR